MQLSISKVTGTQIIFYSISITQSQTAKLICISTSQLMNNIMEAITQEYYLQMKEIDEELESVSTKALFLTMSQACFEEYLKNESTYFSFTQKWFDEKFKFDPAKKSTWFFPLQYSDCQNALNKHPDLFEEHMALMGLKILNFGCLDILNISFEPLSKH